MIGDSDASRLTQEMVVHGVVVDEVPPGSMVAPSLAAYRKGRVLRGTRFDPFDHTKVRRLERELPADYWRRVACAGDHPSTASWQRAVRLARLPDLVRGYEQVKMRSIREYQAGLSEWEAGRSSDV